MARVGAFYYIPFFQQSNGTNLVLDINVMYKYNVSIVSFIPSTLSVRLLSDQTAWYVV